MQWLKAWLMKWLGIDEVRAENAELILRLDNSESQMETLRTCLIRFGEDIESVRQSHVSVKEMGDACMARLDRETMKLATAIDGDRTGVMELFRQVRADLIENLKAVDVNSNRISELEELVKDATLDTALAELEDRVAKIEAVPAPTPGPQGKRGGSAWNSHQVAASAGAALANGVSVPIPTPGIS